MPIQGSEHITTFEKGLNRDFNHLGRPKGSYYKAINAVTNSTEGDLGARTNERGTTLFSTFGSRQDYCIIGKYTLDTDIILFLVTQDNSESEIGITDNQGVYTEVLGPNTNAPGNLLGFNITKQIDVQGRKLFNGNRIVYFSDFSNPMRFLNLDDAPVSDIVNNLQLFPVADMPVIEFNEVTDAGGSVKTGAYQFAARLVTDSLDVTSFGAVSAIVPVVDDDKSSGRDQYDGADFETATDHAISITINNIDTDFKYIDCAVIYYTGASSDIKVEQFVRKEITGSSMSFLYTQEEDSLPLDIGDVTIKPVNYTTAKCVEQKDNRLFFSNLRSQPELEGLQNIALNTEVRYFIDQVAGTNFTDYKDPSLTFYKKGYWRNEVYSFGLVFVYANGSESFAYHIPWRAGNTTILYESNEVYPGDFPGGLAGLRIRHHRMPDLTAEPHYTNIGGTQYIRILGLTFSNIVIPADILSKLNPTMPYYIVRQQRNSSLNRSIWAQGIAQRLLAFEDRIVGPALETEPHKINYLDNSFFFGKTQILWDTHSGDGTDRIQPKHNNFADALGDGVNRYEDRLISFYSPETNFEPKISLSQIDTLEPQLSIGGSIQTTFHPLSGLNAHVGIAPITFLPHELHLHCDYANSPTATAAADVAIVSARADYVPEGSTSRSLNVTGYGYTEDEIHNYDGEGFPFFELNADFPEAADPVNVTITYDHEGTLIGLNRQVIYTTALSATSTRLLYNLTGTNSSQYGPLDLAEYIIVDQATSALQTSMTVYSGDCFITKFSAKNSGRLEFAVNIKDDASAEFKDPDDRRSTEKLGSEYRASTWFWCESEINTNYRHITDSGVPYYPKKSKISGTVNIPLLFGFSGGVESYTSTDDGVLDVDPDFGHSDYYNVTYSKENDVKLYFPKPIGFEEVTDFPYRTIYSSQAISTSQQDNYRIFQANNFQDIPTHTGIIWDTFVHGNRFYVHSIGSLWKTYVNEREQTSTTEGDLFVGNAGVFSHPPSEVLDIDGNYAGTKSQWCGVSTPFGYIFPSIPQGKVFLLTDGLQILSKDGMWRYFTENMDLPDQDNPANPLGYGFIAGYDHDYERYLITKRTALAETESGAKPAVIDPQYPAYTLSCSFLDKSWTSFHTWIPSVYIQEGKSLYTIVNHYLPEQCRLWKHNKGAYGQYYFGPIQPFELVFSINSFPKETKTIDNVVILSDCVDETSDVTKHNDTFDKIQIYNEYQNTDVTNLVYRNTQRRTENQFNIDIPRDAVIDPNVNIFVSTNLDITRTFKPRIRSKYAVVRLIFDNLNNYRLTTNMVRTLFRRSAR